MKYTVYNPDTGAILSVYYISDPAQIDINLSNKTWILGEYSANEYYVVDGVATQLPTNPSTGLLPYEFDWLTHSWQLNESGAGIQIRSQRDQLLSAVDQINPVWYASLTTEQQAELAVYRQALLAVPQQSGFPAVIEWPAKPTWI
jgi:hypothetical protein